MSNQASCQGCSCFYYTSRRGIHGNWLFPNFPFKSLGCQEVDCGQTTGWFPSSLKSPDVVQPTEPTTAAGTKSDLDASTLAYLLHWQRYRMMACDIFAQEKWRRGSKGIRSASSALRFVSITDSWNGEFSLLQSTGEEYYLTQQVESVPPLVDSSWCSHPSLQNTTTSHRRRRRPYRAAVLVATVGYNVIWLTRHDTSATKPPSGRGPTSSPGEEAQSVAFASGDVPLRVDGDAALSEPTSTDLDKWQCDKLFDGVLGSSHRPARFEPAISAPSALPTSIGDCQRPIVPCDHHSAMAAVGRILWAAGDKRIPASLHGQADQVLLLVLLASFHRVLPPIMSLTRFAASRFVTLRGIVILAETPASRTHKFETGCLSTPQDYGSHCQRQKHHTYADPVRALGCRTHHVSVPLLEEPNLVRVRCRSGGEGSEGETREREFPGPGMKPQARISHAIAGNLIFHSSRTRLITSASHIATYSSCQSSHLSSELAGIHLDFNVAASQETSSIVRVWLQRQRDHNIPSPRRQAVNDEKLPTLAARQSQTPRIQDYSVSRGLEAATSSFPCLLGCISHLWADLMRRRRSIPTAYLLQPHGKRTALSLANKAKRPRGAALPETHHQRLVGFGVGGRLTFSKTSCIRTYVMRGEAIHADAVSWPTLSFDSSIPWGSQVRCPFAREKNFVRNGVRLTLASALASYLSILQFNCSTTDMWVGRETRRGSPAFGLTEDRNEWIQGPASNWGTLPLGASTTVSRAAAPFIRAGSYHELIDIRRERTTRSCRDNYLISIDYLIIGVASPAEKQALRSDGFGHFTHAPRSPEGEATVVLDTEALAIYPFVCGLRSLRAWRRKGFRLASSSSRAERPQRSVKGGGKGGRLGRRCAFLALPCLPVDSDIFDAFREGSPKVELHPVTEMRIYVCVNGSATYEGKAPPTPTGPASKADSLAVPLFCSKPRLKSAVAVAVAVALYPRQQTDRQTDRQTADVDDMKEVRRQIDAYFVYFTPETTFPANPRLGSLVTPAKKLHPLLDQNHFCRHLITYGLEESNPGHLHIGIPSRCPSPVSHVPVSKGSRLPDFPAKGKKEPASPHGGALRTHFTHASAGAEREPSSVSPRFPHQNGQVVTHPKLAANESNYGSIRDIYDKSPGLRTRVTFSDRRSLTHGDDDEEQHFRVYCPSLLSSASTRLRRVSRL
ncbi:uncharacterized protein CLUP02_15976 [Colletotrichum lupini]|uniref:Uncharacterized protein n=1 Tax=Colletotrichum lupini TaxID=145971 RepID=A0A9Q8T9F4_9PEZI|nr:uncharacterized protein CLUP02_15976 [Colletotrichum lupini]UQC90446.1 hypothetical protein CLUP02_15976 [Colletotrichum lupini]